VVAAEVAAAGGAAEAVGEGSDSSCTVGLCVRLR
jgi:hypothetical protein